MGHAPRSTTAGVRRCLALTFPVLLGGPPTAAPLSAQGADPPHTRERVAYANPRDLTHLTGTLAVPTGSGPHPAVVLLSVAGTGQLVDHLARLGYAVLIPMRRGFVEVEPLLRATYQDLAGDAQAAVDYLRTRADIDVDAVGLIGQADDAPAAMLAAMASAQEIPLVLLAPPAFPGREVFRLEQRGIARMDGWGHEALEALDRVVDQIASIVLSEDVPNLRAFRLHSAMAAAEVRLPYNAAFPNDEGQIHFFSSPLWHDRLAFDPQQVLSGLHSPVLVLMGTEDPHMPLDPYLAAMRSGLAEARTSDATLCLVRGRTRHSFTAEAVEVIAGWLGQRVRRAGGANPPGEGALPSCLEPPRGG